jgi:hypothetical protein
MENIWNLLEAAFYSGAIDKTCLKIGHVEFETLPLLNMKFLWYFAHFCV